MLDLLLPTSGSCVPSLSLAYETIHVLNVGKFAKFSLDGREFVLFGVFMEASRSAISEK